MEILRSTRIVIIAYNFMGTKSRLITIYGMCMIRLNNGNESKTILNTSSEGLSLAVSSLTSTKG